MTSKQEAKLNMYDSVIKHCEDNSALIKTIPALQNTISAFKITVSAIGNAVQQQLQSGRGYTTTKEENKKALCTFANRVAGAIYAWATDQKDHVIMEKTKTSPTAITRWRDEELLPGCMIYYNLAKANEASLADYGLSTAVIDAFKTAIDSYGSTVPGPRNAAANKTAYGKSLITLFRDADLQLKGKIDKLINGISTAEQQFLNGYKANRMIVDSGHTTTQLSITVTDGENDNPIKGAMITIDGTAVDKLTDKEGSTSIKPIKPGQYHITIRKEGFSTATTEDVKVTLGQATNLAIKLKRV